ncbi:hypothetical protein L227DRAFT_212355 [Lentinus tigrinus ALCF2SS1-6]|uniref:Poly(A) RNA polymerase mitochondrial-like central palm domain-containing protein n=1 Tax=Lentinus tigrinus ALCF2SS1-6 TaxID=1328759 RepID=A0A5C2SQ39_9APHY|nr:hypothetical protein L227DRAFT_212355 [Lentinus tigrinus ALCF2SS1-6]
MRKSAQLLQIASQATAGPSRLPTSIPRSGGQIHPGGSALSRFGENTGHNRRTPSTRRTLSQHPDDPRNIGTTRRILVLFQPHSRHFRRIKDARTATIGRLDALIQGHFGDQYKLCVFGSTCYGAGRPESDLDLCIFDRDRVHGFEPTISMSNLPPIYDVSAIAHVLTQAGYKAVSCIPAATIPIVKLTDPETGLSCDMNVNRRLGVYNTRLFRRYCLVFSPLAPLLRKVKGWTRHIGLNHPSTPGVPPSFSSYALTLMTIAGLQRSGYLPNLQADTRKSVNTHFWEVSKTGERYKVDIRYGKGDQWRHIRLYSLDDVFRAWFRYWGFEHNYQSTSTVLSIRDGGLVRWGSATNLPTGNALHGPRIDYDDPKEYRLVVLDPFIPKAGLIFSIRYILG